MLQIMNYHIVWIYICCKYFTNFNYLDWREISNKCTAVHKTVKRLIKFDYHQVILFRKKLHSGGLSSFMHYLISSDSQTQPIYTRAILFVSLLLKHCTLMLKGQSHCLKKPEVHQCRTGKIQGVLGCSRESYM